MRKLYTAEQLAELLQVKKRTIYDWGKQGVLETVRVAGRVRFYSPVEEDTGNELADH